MSKKLVIASLIFLLCLLAGCSKKAEEQVEAGPLPVQVADVRIGSIQRVITGDGILRARDQSAISSKIAAPVAKFHVDRGDIVKKGQLLVELEGTDLAAAVSDAKGAYDQASAAYRGASAGTIPEGVSKAQSDVEAAKQSMDVAQKLVESRQQLFREGALARRSVDEAAVAHAQAKNQYDNALKHLQSIESVGRHEEANSAKGQMDSAKGKLDNASAMLSYTQLRSPMDGVVADRRLFPGEMATPDAPILTVMDVSSVIARVNVPQAQAIFVKVGQPARIAQTDGSVEVNGRVTVVSPSIDPLGTTVEVWVEAANPGGKLRPGGTVRVHIMADAVPKAVLVPVAALLPGEDGGLSVIVAGTDQKAHRHSVKVGVRNNEAVQILEGVESGAKVVVVGGVGLEDDKPVRIVAAGAKEQDDEEEKAEKK